MSDGSLLAVRSMEGVRPPELGDNEEMPYKTDSSLLNVAPLRLLQDDAIPIMVFVRATSYPSVRIERRDLFEPVSQHDRARGFPL